MTSESATTATGASVNIGDVVVTQGSSVYRKVVAIQNGEVCGNRIDGGRRSESVWLDPKKLRIVKRAS